MKNQHQFPKGNQLKPVSRKTNEEIDDDEGQLIIGGESEEDTNRDPYKIVPTHESESLGKKNNDFEGIED